jgi:hypothetical protein
MSLASRLRNQGATRPAGYNAGGCKARFNYSAWTDSQRLAAMAASRHGHERLRVAVAIWSSFGVRQFRVAVAAINVHTRQIIPCGATALSPIGTNYKIGRAWRKANATGCLSATFLDSATRKTDLAGTTGTRWMAAGRWIRSNRYFAKMRGWLRSRLEGRVP